MKQRIIFSVFTLLIFFAACKKPVETPGPVDPNPTDTSTQRAFRLVFENLENYPSIPNHLTAEITVENMQSSAGEWNIHIPVAHGEKYASELVKLYKGSYKIKKLILRDSAGAALFATPVAGSTKASAVARPLSIPLVLDKKIEKSVAVEVLLINSTDTPESFGYPVGSFGNNGQGGGTDKLIFIRPIIKIGEVIYDSVPVQLIIKSWNDKNEMTYNVHYLDAGTNGVHLSAKATRYQLSISKWGTYDEMLLNKSDVQENTVYDMGGEIAAQKLKTVYEYKLVNGVSTPLTKTDYEYNADGSLRQAQVWGKRADMSAYLIRKDLFDYSGNKITSIRSYNETNDLIKNTTALYNATGRVSGMQEIQGNHTTSATMLYTPFDTRSGLTQDYQLDVKYTHSSGSSAKPSTHSKTMKGGSVLQDFTTSPNGDWEEGYYDYDFCINPYIHLGLPDLSGNQYIKHNIKSQLKTWYGAYPEFEAHAFSYTYDSKGYPTEQLVGYRSYGTKAATHTIRTVFVY